MFVRAFIACLGLIGLMSVTASAARAWDALTCVATPPTPPPNLLPPAFVGIALEDVPLIAPPPASPSWPPLAAYAPAAALALRLPGTLDLHEVLSTAAVALSDDHLIIDVLGRAPRFSDTNTLRSRFGQVGLVRVRLPIALPDALTLIGSPEVLAEYSLTDLAPTLRVSTTEWLALLTDSATGYRRIWPLGGGGLDRGVRNVGVLSSLTPATEDARLDKRNALRQLNNPWYFRNKPYLAIAEGWRRTRPDGTSRIAYVKSNIAFHIWQDKSFERGFFSHGCMRMRTEDLTELTALVFGQAAPFPIALQVAPLPTADHPYPFEREKYWELVNAGTAARPRTRIVEMLYEMKRGTLPLPPPEAFKAVDFREHEIVYTSP